MISREEVEELLAEREAAEQVAAAQRAVEQREAKIRFVAAIPSPSDKPEAFREGFEWMRRLALEALLAEGTDPA